MNNIAPTTSRRDRLIPWYFVIFFGVVIAVNVVMATLAIRTNSGVVTDHPYERGLAYNQVVAAEKTQAALGWKGHIAYANGALQFVLNDPAHHPLVPEEATASITRPTQLGMDFELKLTGASTPLAFPAKGVWDIRVRAVYKGTAYQQSQRIVVE